MPHEIEVEIERNFFVFKEMLAGLLEANAGEYALFHDQKLEGIFSTPGDAGRAGYERFGSKPFSIQLVSEEPVDLGFYSYAASDR